jgi:hypothetical protein
MAGTWERQLNEITSTVWTDELVRPAEDATDLVNFALALDRVRPVALGVQLRAAAETFAERLVVSDVDGAKRSLAIFALLEPSEARILSDQVFAMAKQHANELPDEFFGVFGSAMANATDAKSPTMISELAVRVIARRMPNGIQWLRRFFDGNPGNVRELVEIRVMPLMMRLTPPRIS